MCTSYQYRVILNSLAIGTKPLQFYKDKHACISKTKGFTNFGGSAHYIQKTGCDEVDSLILGVENCYLQK